jgi:deoxyxylulose-5-phosphate synthase
MATQADVDAIISAIAGGESMVRFSDGREVRYRSVDELRQSLVIVRAELAAAQPSPVTTTYSSFERD